MNKDILRDDLFFKYFEITDGILIRDFLGKMSFIPLVWMRLHMMCEKGIKDFDCFDSLDGCRMLEYNQKKYLVLKLKMWRYVIIDIDKMDNISEEVFLNEIDVDFFLNNFDEVKEEDGYRDLYRFEKYNGDIQELVDFYIENQDILNLSSRVYCKLKQSDAWTWLFIDLINGKVQMGFETDNQFLYEQLFFNWDLTACEMQDAQEKMGFDNMYKIFLRVKDMMIPRECIPDDLYQLYLMKSKIDKNRLILKK